MDPVQIHVLFCVDGDYAPLGWYAKGHVSDEDFTAALRRHTPIWPEWEQVPRLDQDPIRREYWRRVPRRFGESQFYRARPGSPGAFPVTYLAKEIEL